METFKKREIAYESAYAREQELSFVCRCRAARIFGILVARALDLSEGETRRYASRMAVSALNHCSLEALRAKALRDLSEQGIDTVSPRRLDRMLQEAIRLSGEEILHTQQRVAA